MGMDEEPGGRAAPEAQSWWIMVRGQKTAVVRPFISTSRRSTAQPHNPCSALPQTPSAVGKTCSPALEAHPPSYADSARPAGAMATPTSPPIRGDVLALLAKARLAAQEPAPAAGAPAASAVLTDDAAGASASGGNDCPKPIAAILRAVSGAAPPRSPVCADPVAALSQAAMTLLESLGGRRTARFDRESLAALGEGDVGRLEALHEVPASASASATTVASAVGFTVLYAASVVLGRPIHVVELRRGEGGVTVKTERITPPNLPSISTLPPLYLRAVSYAPMEAIAGDLARSLEASNATLAELQANIHALMTQAENRERAADQLAADAVSRAKSAQSAIEAGNAALAETQATLVRVTAAQVLATKEEAATRLLMEEAKALAAKATRQTLMLAASSEGEKRCAAEEKKRACGAEERLAAVEKELHATGETAQRALAAEVQRTRAADERARKAEERLAAAKEAEKKRADVAQSWAASESGRADAAEQRAASESGRADASEQQAARTRLAAAVANNRLRKEAVELRLEKESWMALRRERAMLDHDQVGCHKKSLSADARVGAQQ
jgi:hypothetical protein